MTMVETSSGIERRMVVQKLDAWREARGDDGPLPTKAALEQEFVAVAPSSFVLEISEENVEPTFVSVGATITELQGANMVGKPASTAEPESFIGRALQSLPIVLNKKVPATASGDFVQASGQKIIYRSILMPLSAASEKVNIILGAVSFKEEQ